MFGFLEKIGSGLYERYLTLERNVRARSNSFYDAYLDLQEHFVKTALSEQPFDIKLQETCGAILRREDVRTFFRDTLGIDEHTYAKMQDYTLKVNAHKHKGEKAVQLETVVSYLRILHGAASAYAAWRGIAAEPFDADRYTDLFGAFERENAELKREREALREELSALLGSSHVRESDIAAYRSLFSAPEPTALPLQEENAELQRQISMLKDIKLSSMEDKLNRTIELLLSLQESVTENRAVSYAVGDTICGRERFRAYVERAKGDIENG